ncbi:MAG: HTTM domain-containing protein, partial [Flavobacteriaceae bacterium]|nr:HTTM domain-containing protein [Flavobacteriaceae bacterium]
CLIFFDSTFHDKIIEFISKRIKFFNKGILVLKKEDFNYSVSFKKISFSVICIFLAFQLILPIRYKFYPGELFWNERGYRFSWRVMLVEKKGFTNFKVIDKDNDKIFYVDNEAYLTEFQEKQMSFQPDFIYEFANYLGDSYTSKGFRNVEIHVDSYVTLNGRRSERLIKADTNIYKVGKAIFYKNHIIPYKYEIKKI